MILWFHGCSRNTWCITRLCTSAPFLTQQRHHQAAIVGTLLATEIKSHIFVWIMPTAVPGDTYSVGLAWPRGQSCPGGIFLVRPRAHSCCLSQPHHTYLQVLSLLVKLFCFVCANTLQETHQNPLKCSQSSAENHRLCSGLLSWTPVSLPAPVAWKTTDIFLPLWTQLKLPSQQVQQRLYPNTVT